MRDLNEIYHYAYDRWIEEQLNPEEQIFHRRPVHEPSGIGELFRARERAPERPVVDEAEQVRREDEYLKQFGV